MSKMLHKDKVYKKKLRINHLLTNNSLDLMSSDQRLIQNPEGEYQKQKDQEGLLRKGHQTMSKNRSFEKEIKTKRFVNTRNEQHEHMRVIFKQVNSQCNLFSRNENKYISSKRLQNRKSKGLLLDHLGKREAKIDQTKNKQQMVKYQLPKHFNRYSSLNESCQNLIERDLILKEKSATFRHDEGQKLSLFPKPKKKSKLALFSYDKEQLQLIKHESSGKSLTKMTSILKLKPKNYINSKKATKITAMNKYDLSYENIRLAYKLLSMKPTKPCDLKEQKKFYKKQEYFKEVRSRTIEMNQPVPLNLISQSISFPKINERFHTTIQ